MRVFILGAGFSKPLGLPLAAELTTLLLEEHSAVVGDGQDDMRDWMSRLVKRIDTISAASGPVNIEQLFHLAQYDAEYYRLLHQLSSFNRHEAGAPWELANRIEWWLKLLTEYMVELIWRLQQDSTLDRLKEWCSYLRADDEIVSFNYDTLVETSLDSNNQSWHHGMPLESNDGIRISKLHGSINWVKHIRSEEYLEDKCELLFRKSDTTPDQAAKRPAFDEDAFDLVRVHDLNSLNKQIVHRNVQQDRKETGIAGLGVYKPLHSIPGLVMPWKNSHDALKNADEIMVIGFSLSEFDDMALMHLSSAISSRTTEIPKVWLVDPSADQLAKRFECVFRNVQPINAYWEDIDWSSGRPKIHAAVRQTVVARTRARVVTPRQ